MISYKAQSNTIQCLAGTLIILLLTTISCRKADLRDYEFVDLDDADTTYLFTHNDTLFGLLASKGMTWQMWEDIHENCIESKWTRRARYFGVSSTLSLGTIMDRKFKTVYNTLDGIVTDQELASIIDEGAPQPCDYSRQVTFDLDSELSMAIGGQDQELDLFYSNRRNTNVQINGWQQQNLLTDRLIENITASNDPKKILYGQRLMEGSNRLLSTVIKINGFTSSIESSKKISAELKAKLDSGLISGKIGNTGINVTLEYQDSTRIKIVSNTDFYVYAKFVRTRKL